MRNMYFGHPFFSNPRTNKTAVASEECNSDDAESVPTILPPDGLPLTSTTEGGDGGTLDSK